MRGLPWITAFGHWRIDPRVAQIVITVSHISLYTLFLALKTELRWKQTSIAPFRLISPLRRHAIVIGYHNTDVQIVSCIYTVRCLLTKKQQQPIRLCLSTHVSPRRKLFSPTWRLKQAFCMHNWSIIQNITLKHDLFLNGISLVKTNHCSACKSNLCALPTSKLNLVKSS